MYNSLFVFHIICYTSFKLITLLIFIVAVVVDITNKWTNNRINEDVLQALENFKDKKSILIMNKV